MSNDQDQVTRRILFSGRVQGVGFRWTTSRMAARYPVTGFVRNLSDGRVELVAQGRVTAVVDLLSAVQAAMNENIESVVEEEVDSSEPYAKFEVRR